MLFVNSNLKGELMSLDLDLMENTELDYIRCFSDELDNVNYHTFWDKELPGMYCHNVTVINSSISEKEILNIIANETLKREKDNHKFAAFDINKLLQRKTYINIGKDLQEFSHYDYMYINLFQDDNPILQNKNQNCVVKKVIDKGNIVNDAIKINIENNSKNMGENFATARINRKMKAYLSSENNLSLYLCYYNGQPIGSCELLLNGQIAKIEDFDVNKDYQRKGFGTNILRFVLSEAKTAGAKYTYLYTDSEDTAKDMYSKCGFVKIADKTNLRFSI